MTISNADTLKDNALAEEDLLTRSFIYKFLASAFRYPEKETYNCLKELWENAENTISEFLELVPIFKQLTEKFKDCSLEQLENQYISLFGHTAQGTCPPFEIEYGESNEQLQKPHELSDIAAFYRASGIKQSAKSNDREDFIAVELEFMYFIYYKQSYAKENNDLKLVESCIDLKSKFLKDHLARWIPAFSNTIKQNADDSFYGVLAKLTNDFVLMCCKETGVKSGSEKLRIRKPIEKPEDCQSCSFAEN